MQHSTQGARRTESACTWWHCKARSQVQAEKSLASSDWRHPGPPTRPPTNPSCAHRAAAGRAPCQRCRGCSQWRAAPRQKRWAGGAGSCSRSRDGCSRVGHSGGKQGDGKGQFGASRGAAVPRCARLWPACLPLHPSPDGSRLPPTAPTRCRGQSRGSSRRRPSRRRGSSRRRPAGGSDTG